MRRSMWTAAALLLCGALLGCADGGNDPDPDVEVTNPAVPTTPGGPEKMGVIPGGTNPTPENDSLVDISLPTRETMAGTWLLVLTQRRVDFPAVLVDVTRKDGGGYGVALGAANPGLPEMKLLEAKAEDKTLELSLEFEETKVSIEGRLEDGTVYASIVFDDGLADPARLFATKRTTIGDLNPRPTTGRSDWEALGVQGQSPDPILTFCAGHARDPLSMDLLLTTLRASRQMGMTVPQVESLLLQVKDQAKRWGPRYAREVELQAVANLAQSRGYPETAARMLDALEKQFGEKPGRVAASVLAQSRGTVVLDQAILGTRSDDEAARDAGRKRLESMYAGDPLNHAVLSALALDAERQGATDRALDWFAHLVALPGMAQNAAQEWNFLGIDHAPPKSSMEKLWKDKHGNLDGLPDFLRSTNRKAMAVLGGEKVPPRQAAPGNHVVLVELFTGAACPPCVAADVGAAGLENAYAPSEVVVLRYHQHIPGPDPLSNADSDARFAYYGFNSTPTFAVDGERTQGLGGPVFVSRMVCGALKQIVSKKLETRNDVLVTVAAQSEGGTLRFSAEASGLPPDAKDLRLRLVLAEEEAEYPAQNGIRSHTMLVRAMPGGASGFSPVDGKLKAEQSLTRDALRAALLDYLIDFESRHKMSFPAKPVDVQRLHLVAFVQEEGSKKILQTASVPISGLGPETTTPETPATGKPSTEKPADPKPETPPKTEAEPDAPKPADTRPADPKTTETKPAEPKPAEPKNEEAKPEDPKPADALPKDPKTEGPEPVAPKP